VKKHLFVFGLLVSASLHPAAARQSGVSASAMGNEYLYIEPGKTTCVSPQFLYTGAGLLTQGGVTTNVIYGTNNNQVLPEQVTNGQIATLSFSNNYATGGNFKVTAVTPVNAEGSRNYSLKLAGNPPKNAAGVPLKPNQYSYVAGVQPVTYYALVTAGKSKGDYFTVQGNSSNSLFIDPEGLTLDARDITAVNLLPYWSLSSLFPPSQATISFIPTTDASNIMTTVVISPPVTYGTQQPQNVGPSFYFSAALTNWVSTTNPSVPAGDEVIQPGAYVYLQNTGSNNYPLHVFLSGSVLTNQFNFYFTTSRTSSATSYFSLPRNSSYPIGQIGFNDSNFTQSTGTTILQRNDLLIIDDSNGGVAATFYRYKNQWYNTDNPVPTNPVFPPGTVFGLKKPSSSRPGTSLLINQSNIR
jgi:uncharacterized protein (TIGR02597 family)